MSRLIFFPAVIFSVLAGCSRPVPPVVQTKPPDVTVALPTVRNVTDYEDFTGRTVAYKSVEIKPRVTGELLKIHFEDGVDVKAGDPLFDIDPKIYLADYEKAKAALLQAEAKVVRLKRDENRVQLLIKAKSNSPEELDRITGDLEEAVASVQYATRQVESAKVMLDYTQIRAPISGRISKRNLDPGSLVKADDTSLTTIVSTDVLYADFDMDDRTLLRLNELIAKGEIKSARARSVGVKIGLPNRDDFSRDGTIIFEDNQVNRNTGTITVRAKMDNSDKILTPGLFVRVRLNVGSEKRSILVPEVAIGTDQGLKYVFVVNDKDEVEARRVKLGLPVDSMRVVHSIPDDPNSGVRENDRVIVKGLQRVREKAKVTASFEKSAPTPVTPTAGKG